MTISTAEFGNDGSGLMPGAEDEVGRLIRRAVKKSGLNTEQVAAALSVRAGARITPNKINDWTAASKKLSNFPLKLLHIFCEVTGDDALQRFAAGTKLAKMIRLGENVAQMLHDDKKKAPKGRRG
jgi:hypothetical protein